MDGSEEDPVLAPFSAYVTMLCGCEESARPWAFGHQNSYPKPNNPCNAAFGTSADPLLTGMRSRDTVNFLSRLAKSPFQSENLFSTAICALALPVLTIPPA